MLIMKNVSKTFNPGTVNEKCALKNLNLELKDGDFATIIGSNGAGKSIFAPKPQKMHISAVSMRRIKQNSGSTLHCLIWG